MKNDNETTEQADENAEAQLEIERTEQEQAAAERESAPEPTGPKVKCAGCGKSVVLDTEYAVGNREPIKAHSCDQMSKKMHAFWIESLNNPEAEAPAVTK